MTSLPEIDEETLEKRVQSKVQTAEKFGDFVHELRTHLTTPKGYLQIYNLLDYEEISTLVEGITKLSDLMYGLLEKSEQEQISSAPEITGLLKKVMNGMFIYANDQNINSKITGMDQGVKPITNILSSAYKHIYHILYADNPLELVFEEEVPLVLFDYLNSFETRFEKGKANKRLRLEVNINSEGEQFSYIKDIDGSVTVTRNGESVDSSFEKAIPMLASSITTTHNIYGIVKNLVENAVKYSSNIDADKNNIIVTYDHESGEEKESKITVWNNSNLDTEEVYRTALRNKIPGVHRGSRTLSDPSVLDILSSRGYSTGKKDTKMGLGRGFGLAMIKEYGRLNLTSTENYPSDQAFTEFTVYLPQRKIN